MTKEQQTFSIKPPTSNEYKLREGWSLYDKRIDSSGYIDVEKDLKVILLKDRGVAILSLRVTFLLDNDERVEGCEARLMCDGVDCKTLELDALAMFDECFVEVFNG